MPEKRLNFYNFKKIDFWDVEVLLRLSAQQERASAGIGLVDRPDCDFVSHTNRHYILPNRVCKQFFENYCNSVACCAIILTAMVDVRAKAGDVTDTDERVRRARTDSFALGQLYELYYARIFKFCVHRLFNKEIAEDVTSVVFLDVARKVRSFRGQTEADFRNWLYRIAANKANAYIRKTSRREKLLEQAAKVRTISIADCSRNSTALDWPTLYAAMLKLKPKYQTVVTLRFFENLSFEEIGRVLKTRPGTARVVLGRALCKLREDLQGAYKRGE